MSYVPINLDMYTAAYAGCIYGLTANQAGLNGTHPYTNHAAAAGAWAQACDQAWNSASADWYDMLSMQNCSSNFWATRAIGPANDPTYQQASTWTTEATDIVALIKAGETYFTGQGITPPAIPTGGSTVTWSADLAGSTNTVQRVVALSGAEIIPLAPNALEGTEIGAWGIIAGITNCTLWLGPSASELTPSTSNWAISSDGTNLFLNAPAGEVELGAAGTTGNIAVFTTAVAEIAGALGGISSGNPLAMADSSVTLAATGTTNLTAAQQRTPSLTLGTVSIGGAGATLNFGNVGGSPGTSAAIYDLDCSAVTTGGNSFTLVNGSASENIAPLFASTLVPLFRVKCQLNRIAITQ